jgi:hypothetical protein
MENAANNIIQYMKIQHRLEDNRRGSFFIMDKERQIAELDYDLNNGVLNAYHTGVRPELEGQGIAGMLFDELVKYARDSNYKVIPTCSYILVKFRRNPEKYSDIWFRMDNEPSGACCGVRPK